MARRWARHTPDVGRLPDRKKREATLIPSLRSLYRDEDRGHVDDPTTSADDRTDV